MINTEIVLWAPPLRFWHGATRGLNPALGRVFLCFSGGCHICHCTGVCGCSVIIIIIIIMNVRFTITVH